MILIQVPHNISSVHFQLMCHDADSWYSEDTVEKLLTMSKLIIIEER